MIVSHLSPSCLGQAISARLEPLVTRIMPHKPLIQL